jgi:sulfate adenylyltransferase subunit 1
MVLPSGLVSTVKEIFTYEGSLPEAFCPQSITLVLNHDIDISRGDLIVGKDSLPGASTEQQARICWMHQRPLQRGKKYFLKHTARTVQAMVCKIENRINISTLEPEPEPAELALNDIGEIRLQTSQRLFFDGYTTNRLTGSFILIEQSTNATVGAGLLFPPSEAARPDYNDFAI